MHIDRFSFTNGVVNIIEFDNEHQAQETVQSLNGQNFMGKELRISRLKDKPVSNSTSNSNATKRLGKLPRTFAVDEVSISEAVKPLLEGRRMMLSVETPGWGEPHSTFNHNRIAKEKIEQYLGQYGIEACSSLRPFHGDYASQPRMLCFLDFETTAGAEQAVQAVHDTEIDGRKVWLKPSQLAPWRAHQIGKWDKAALKELQAAGVAPLETHENKAVKGK